MQKIEKISSLVLEAARTAGTASKLAEKLHTTSSRVSEWKTGRVRPSASEVAYMADLTGKNVFDTLADIEAERDPEFAEFWEEMKRHKKHKG